MLTAWTTDGFGEDLARAGLVGFEDLWSLDRGFVEEPNVRRGGWSGVSRISVPAADGQDRWLYLKRQSNHVIRSWRHALRGELTLHREVSNLILFRRLGIPAPTPLHFATRRRGGQREALMLVAEVPGVTLKDWLLAFDDRSSAERRTVVTLTAHLCRQLWHHRFAHRALYPKHIFLDLDQTPPAVATIDLEKTRRFHSTRSFLRDLDALNRRTARFSRSDRLRFLLAVFGAQRVTPQVRAAWAHLGAGAAKRPTGLSRAWGGLP